MITHQQRWYNWYPLYSCRCPPRLQQCCNALDCNGERLRSHPRPADAEEAGCVGHARLACVIGNVACNTSLMSVQPGTGIMQNGSCLVHEHNTSSDALTRLVTHPFLKGEAMCKPELDSNRQEMCEAIFSAQVYEHACMPRRCRVSACDIPGVSNRMIKQSILYRTSPKEHTRTWREQHPRGAQLLPQFLLPRPAVLPQPRAQVHPRKHCGTRAHVRDAGRVQRVCGWAVGRFACRLHD